SNRCRLTRTRSNSESDRLSWALAASRYASSHTSRNEQTWQSWPPATPPFRGSSDGASILSITRHPPFRWAVGRSLRSSRPPGGSSSLVETLLVRWLDPFVNRSRLLDAPLRSTFRPPAALVGRVSGKELSQSRPDAVQFSVDLVPVEPRPGGDLFRRILVQVELLAQAPVFGAKGGQKFLHRQFPVGRGFL